MKLSFSLSSKPSSKQQQPKSSRAFDGEDRAAEAATTGREYVTEFDPSKTLAPDQQTKKLVIPPKRNEWRIPHSAERPNTIAIPPKENQWRPSKKMRNLDLPVQSDDPNIRFEVESSSLAEGVDSNMNYGLNLRQTNKVDDDDDASKKSQSDDRPRLSTVDSSVEGVMLQKLKDDLKRLPDHGGLDEFSEVPVEGFGAALLAGYGWCEGRGIGRNAKEDVKVVQYERRTAKEGLGFVADLHNSDGPADAVKKKEKEQGSGRGGEHRYYVGKDVRIVGGRDMGLKGRIVEMMGGGDSVVLRLLKSEEEVLIQVSNLAELGSVEEEMCLKKLKELRLKDRTSDSGGQRVKDSSGGRSHREDRDRGSRDVKKESRRSDRREEERTSLTAWLSSHIRVRIISKELKGGRLYLKKGVVVDVVGRTTCDISIDETKELVQDVCQDLLETAIPRRGGPVLVLYGTHKGVYGSLVEKDVENETGVIRDADSHALLNVRLDQIAEYVGDPSFIGY